jgi:hypothetical protein
VKKPTRAELLAEVLVLRENVVTPEDIQDALSALNSIQDALDDTRARITRLYWKQLKGES